MATKLGSVQEYLNRIGITNCMLIYDDLGQCLGFAVVSIDTKSNPYYIYHDGSGMFAKPTFSRSCLYCKDEDFGTPRGWQAYLLSRADILHYACEYWNLVHPDKHRSLEQLSKAWRTFSFDSMKVQLLQLVCEWRDEILARAEVGARREHEFLLQQNLIGS